MELKLKLAHNNICHRLDCVEIKKCVCVYIILSHKLWYMLLGTVRIFISYMLNSGWCL